MTILNITSHLSADRTNAFLFNQQEYIEDAREFAFKITSNFEGGRVDSLQTKDSGIVSYGTHQATLSSGSLYRLIKSFTSLSGSQASRNLTLYLERLATRDSTLRSDQNFIALLKSAASDPLMAVAQENFFTKEYWLPVLQKSIKCGVSSKAGLTIFYDTNIQGGLNKILSATENKTRNSAVSEHTFLRIFLSERVKYLSAIAARKRSLGDTQSAAMLENSTKTRIQFLRNLIN